MNKAMLEKTAGAFDDYVELDPLDRDRRHWRGLCAGAAQHS
jgi:hypothetical protein